MATQPKIQSEHFTPGPWTTHESHVYAPDGAILALVRNPGRVASDYPLVANANLIAAAPTLFVALEDFDNWFCGFDPEDQASRMEGRRVVIRARAALALALGKAA